jgi:hypothetical protein
MSGVPATHQVTGQSGRVVVRRRDNDACLIRFSVNDRLLTSWPLTVQRCWEATWWLGGRAAYIAEFDDLHAEQQGASYRIYHPSLGPDNAFVVAADDWNREVLQMILQTERSNHER